MSDATPDPTCPLTRREVTDRYFLEHRAKLLDLAAYLDRLDRAPGSKGPTPTPGSGNDASGATSGGDYRDKALREAIAILTDGNPHRARRVLERLSDPTLEPINQAPGKGAAGAYADEQN